MENDCSAVNAGRKKFDESRGKELLSHALSMIRRSRSLSITGVEK